jgi:hypothetical protein
MRSRSLHIVLVLGIAGVFLAVAMTRGSSSSTRATYRVAKANEIQGIGSRNEASESDRAGGPSAAGEDPSAAAKEEYRNQSYPAPYTPFQLTRNAQKAWVKTKARGVGSGPKTPGNWALAGPSNANFPDVLTFSGASYTTSGRITALAVDPNCTQSSCRAWAAAAGGGVWRTNNALSGNGVSWTFISGSFATNAIGALTYDASTNTLYAGTGEPNASGDSEAGFGIYKSTDGGNTWTHLAAITSVPTGSGVDCDAVFGVPPGTFGVQHAPAYSGPAFDGRSISSIVVRGNTMYVGSARGVRGVSSVTGGVVSLAPGLPPYGIWKSTDGGATFTLLNYQDVCLNPTLPGSAGIVQASFGSTRGVHEVEADPGYNTNQTLYAGAFPQNNAIPLNTKGGVWRSTDAGANWVQIKNALNPAQNTDRASFDVTPIAGGSTRMYVGVGNASIAACATCDGGSNQARLYRTDNAVTATNAAFTDLTAIQQTSSAPNQTINYCGDPAVGGAQCWYDNVVYTPPGKPDVVYLGGSFNYTNYGFRNNGRAFIRSTDAGVHFTDMTWDATTGPTPPGSCCQPNPISPNGMHPDSHAIAEIPGTNSAIFGSDGGLVRSSGAFSDISPQCSSRPLSPLSLATCQQLLSAVPSQLFNLNKGLSTLQFQSLSVAADNPKHVQGGTQDNGTLETNGSAVTWPQIIYGDGGQSGFNATNSSLRFNSFTGAFHDVNFQNGDPTKWVIASGPIASTEPAAFYAPIVADPNPAAAGTIFEGALSVWRTQDWAGNQAFLEANCPEFTTSGANPACGDFVRIGPAGATNLTASAADYRGTSRAGGNLAAVERTPSDTGTLWAATGTGRVFVSHNADAAGGSVTFTRLDSLAANSPGRFVSGIYVDPSNANHAWIAYGSYSSLTPSTPGHLFSVTYDPVAGTATWTNLDGSGAGAFPDFPATDVVYDQPTGDLYASNDWGVLRLASGSSNWVIAGGGLPNVEVAGLTIAPGGRKLYAATHGRSAWVLNLP